MRKLLLLSSILFIGVISCNKDDSKDGNETPTIGLNHTSLTLSTGDTTTLVATILSEQSPTAEFEWSSGDESVVIINEDGFLTAIAAGEATITASSMGADATCNITVNPSTYVIGSSKISSGDYIGIVWRNGVAIDTLTNSDDGNIYGESIWVGGGDIYSLYSLNYSSMSTPMSSLVTKNGQDFIEYSNSSDGYSCSEVVVYDNDVFTSGTIYGTNSQTAAYWNDNTLASLTAASTNSNASAIAVDEHGVYVGGYSYSTEGVMVATIWINSAANYLSSSESDVNDIAVSNGDIYAVGNCNDTATIWINNEQIKLDTTAVSSMALSVAIDGDDYYVAGFIDNSSGAQVPVYWKNGVINELGDGAVYGTANSIMVLDGDVYITGTTYSSSSQVATMWVNGKLTQLSDLSYFAQGNGIFVR